MPKAVGHVKVADKIKLPLLRDKLSAVPAILSVIFYIIWIIVGIALLLIIYGNFKQGAFKALFSTPSPPPQVETPTETSIPGIGKVSIACVQSALTPEAIQKILSDGNTSNLTAGEKAKFEPCIVEAETATPEASPGK